MHRFLKSFKFAVAGIKYAFATQVNFKFHTMAIIVVAIAGFWVDLSAIEWLWILASIGMVVSVELLNTAIETLVDLVSPDYNVKAGIVKDLSAGAVLVISILAAVIGLLIFFPKIF
ncbi:MAG: diacylglycerol kinase [Sphingobacteriales bacterium]|nr:diacylglycerol kinase [Sphingobacteriales bacterium]